MSTVLVTGGSRGIGRAICLAFAEAGYDVAFCYAKDGAGAEKTRAMLERTGAGVQCFCCDVSNEQSVQEMFSSLFGLEVLVNNAGISSFGMIQETSLAQWERVFAVNSTGAFLCTRAAVPKFLQRGEGCVINVSSMWGETGASCEAAYSASKAALIGFTKAAAKELGPSNIRVNALSCGMIGTKMNEVLSAEDRRAFVRDLPVAREGSAEEVAQAALFLAKNRYITGEVLRINGGAVI